MKKLIFSITITFFLNGCATVMLGEYQTIKVTSDPPGAKITIRNQVKVAPAEFKVKRGLLGLDVFAEKEGYMPLREHLKSEISGLAYTDTLFATSVQSYTNPRYYVYKPSKVHFKMIREEKAQWRDVRVVINSLEVQPQIISPGASFGYNLSFSILDNTNLDSYVDVSIEYAIMQNNKILFHDTVNEKISKKDIYITTKKDLIASRNRGKYQMLITIRYKDISAKKMALFEIR